METNFENKSSITKPKLYALLIGIANYEERITLHDKVRFPKLTGPTKDIASIRAYLGKEEYYDVHIISLADKEATKSTIVDTFRQHLGQAKENDVALFYYSGHGTQEYADDAWHSATEGKLSSLACYYDENNKHEFLLSNKELRWLVNRISSNGGHVVTIFDCCHSGGMTRNNINNYPSAIVKSVPYTFPKRNWSDFIFSNSLNREEVIEKGEVVAIPEGFHIELSASESNAPALEINGEGIFTKMLLKVLNTANGNISYHSLNSRVRQYIRNIYEQIPRIYIANDFNDGLSNRFLNKPYLKDKLIQGEIVYNEKMGWILNRGIIHGVINDSLIKGRSEKNPIIFHDFYTINPGLDTTRLRISENIDDTLIYHTILEGVDQHTIRLYLDKTSIAHQLQLNLLEELYKEENQFIILEETEENAQYVVRYLNGRYYITHPNNPFRPLVKTVEADNGNIHLILKYLRHIADWVFLKNLVSGDSDLLNSLKIEIATGIPIGPLTELEPKGNPFALALLKQPGNNWKNAISVRLTNTSTQDIYCCALYFPADFECFSDFFDTPVLFLPAGHSANLKLNKSIKELPVEMSNTMRWFNWETMTDQLKIIISMQEFDNTGTALSALPGPYDEATRGLIFKRSKLLLYSSWAIKDIVWSTINPLFNVFSEDELSKLIANKEITNFARGLYFDTYKNNDGSPAYKVKESIQYS